MLRTLLPALTMLVAVTSAQAETIENPAYKTWAGQKVGTVVTLSMATEAGATKSDATMTYTLTALTAEGATVEMVTTVKTSGMEFKTPAQKVEVKKLVELPPGRGKDHFDKPEGLVEQGTETVKIDGVEYKTKWTVTKTNANGAEMEAKVWVADEVPNMLVKMESKSKVMGTASTTTMTLLSVKKP